MYNLQTPKYFIHKYLKKKHSLNKNFILNLFSMSNVFKVISLDFCIWTYFVNISYVIERLKIVFKILQQAKRLNAKEN